MGNFFFWTFLFLLVGAILLYNEVDIRFISEWLGNLPGDMTIKKDGAIFHLPLTSAMICSLVMTVISFGFKKK